MTGTTTPTPAPAVLFERLLDDAALFPPAGTPMPAAVAAHDAWRNGPAAHLVGPFVCPLVSWDLFSAEPGDFPVAVTLLQIEAIPTAVARAGRRLAQLEIGGGRPAAVAEVARGVVPDGVPVYVEVPVAQVTEAVCKELEAEGLGLKLRTGGTSADLFPTEEELGSALYDATRTGVATKLTAGLHHPVRHRDDGTGFEHHGFGNVMLAVHAALTGGEQAAVVAALAEQDPGAVADGLRALTADEATAVRRTFRSIGTCSIDEPLADLVDLGLLEDPRR